MYKMVSYFSKPIATESFYPVTCSIKALQDTESVSLLCNPNTLRYCEKETDTRISLPATVKAALRKYRLKNTKERYIS